MALACPLGGGGPSACNTQSPPSLKPPRKYFLIRSSESKNAVLASRISPPPAFELSRAIRDVLSPPCGGSRSSNAVSAKTYGVVLSPAAHNARLRRAPRARAARRPRSARATAARSLLSNRPEAATQASANQAALRQPNRYETKPQGEARTILKMG